ncbi:hypothetical protein ACJ6WF_43110 [Streptomyces sp. MMS24-I2-30]|uniref:hypothetical protein n=1 Tax=Streptomyces sp. MMS24-I2-30 TaxID=3351564 RepID=UPI003896841C
MLGDDFQITLGGATYTKRKDAAVPLTEALAGVVQALPDDRAVTRELPLGQLRGRQLVRVAYREDDGEQFVRVHLDGLTGSLQHFTVAELGGLKGKELLRHLTKTLSEAPSGRARTRAT